MYLNILLFFALVSSLSLWITVLVFSGYTVTHWACICTSLDTCFSLCSLWMPLSVFGNIVTDCPWIGSSLDPHFDLSFSLTVWVSAYITANSACICTSLFPCFSHFFLWTFILVSECIIVHSWCICTYLDPCFWLFFFIYVCVRLYCHWLSYLLFPVFVYLSVPVFLSVRVYYR